MWRSRLSTIPVIELLLTLVTPVPIVALLSSAHLRERTRPQAMFFEVLPEHATFVLVPDVIVAVVPIVVALLFLSTFALFGGAVSTVPILCGNRSDGQCHERTQQHRCNWSISHVFRPSPSRCSYLRARGGPTNSNG